MVLSPMLSSYVCRQREGGETYSQAPDLATVTEEEAALEQNTGHLSLKEGSLSSQPETHKPPPGNVVSGDVHQQGLSGCFCV